MQISPTSLWAKLSFKDETLCAWHSLVDHSADVAAVTLALLHLPVFNQRLARAFGQERLSKQHCQRLAVIAFLHDIGKANRGFQARVNPKAQTIGHIAQLAWLREEAPLLCERLIARLGLERLNDWFTGSTAEEWPWVMLAHHGKPAKVKPSLIHWQAQTDSDPIAALAPMRAAMDHWFAEAFAPGEVLPGKPEFDHAFAGLLMLADWLGSHTRFFPMANGAEADRWGWALPQAKAALLAVGLDVEPRRQACQTRQAGFSELFAMPAPRLIQQAVLGPSAPCLVLEAETGSGKTEAALWRFVELFRSGAVDGLYFALPTRVAATQIFTRVRQLVARLFPEDDAPSVVLAVPGQIRADSAKGHSLPEFGFEWDDVPTQKQQDQRWAAEHPKRFLAAQIAVGTIDQALLGGIRTKHAHLRGTCLLRHLLVVDEVHASDHFQAALLSNLLHSHVQAGGHALLLSATLGGAARAELLGVKPPSFAAAESSPYPALSWAEQGELRVQPIPAEGSGKTVRLTTQDWLDAPEQIARLAYEAASQGAKVLIIRNTVRTAIATQKAVEALGAAALLFRVQDIPTLHHGRFGTSDRLLLDAEIEARLGKQSEAKPVILVGTQTVEVSLDLSAHFLITDLAPVDVLLQRIGRLHRHAGTPCPASYQTPQAVVLTPKDGDILAALRRSGHGFGRVYTDARILVATLRLLKSQPVWQIPAMNRQLVEQATHPETLGALEKELRQADPAWNKYLDKGWGVELSQKTQGDLAMLKRDDPFSKFQIPEDEAVATRLGAKDRLVTFRDDLIGPFGSPIGALRVPHFLAQEAEETEPEIISQSDGDLTFRFGKTVLQYGRLGLQKA